jgi:hypothetical protein
LSVGCAKLFYFAFILIANIMPKPQLGNPRRYLGRHTYDSLEYDE